jgi:hypothetical protein
MRSALAHRGTLRAFADERQNAEVHPSDEEVCTLFASAVAKVEILLRNSEHYHIFVGACLASAFGHSKDSILCHRFSMFSTISGNLLLARSKPRSAYYMEFWSCSGTADFSRPKVAGCVDLRLFELFSAASKDGIEPQMRTQH